MFNPLDLFSSIKSAVITIGVIAMLSLIGTLWVQKGLAERRAETLASEKAKLESAVLSREIEVDGLKVSLTELQNTLFRIGEHKSVEDANNKEIDNAPPESDGPVASVLRDALRGVERMYNHAH
ncbi:hypothetical protein [Mesorhizobium sp. M8A.F.Ca.ET.021.01.1.1]|uniref:hypothetical protein n=1 Tax=Mesorhizobium sp. M8A.F.Ca.ET.021.01.1.1 TaxID=2496757 RepID=UPI000FCC87E5|nr:hypothetical protein [Mesorhizobium sp. M8A.F.Ca.ET.021.01.1.1]RUW56366.1 hypothetical protein EOA36_04465 [Mesorhizobium sp. M8A.F.Ca.ET.021.01.1.1]